MLDAAVAAPAPLGAPARRDPAAADTDGASVRQGDDGTAADSDIAAGGDEAGSGEQVQRLVGGERLDDAVQIEPDPGRSEEHPADEVELPPAAWRRLLGRPRIIVVQQCEVAVVAG